MTEAMADKSVSEVRNEIEENKRIIEEIKSKSKQTEKDLDDQIKILSKEKSDLITGIEARMQLIDMIKRDIYRMSYEEGLRAIKNQSKTWK